MLKKIFTAKVKGYLVSNAIGIAIIGITKYLIDRNGHVIDAVRNEVLSWDGTSESRHKYGGTQFDCCGKEIGHIHGNGILDILFSKKIKEQLLAEGKIMVIIFLQIPAGPASISPKNRMRPIL